MDLSTLFGKLEETKLSIKKFLHTNERKCNNIVNNLFDTRSQPRPLTKNQARRIYKRIYVINRYRRKSGFNRKLKKYISWCTNISTKLHAIQTCQKLFGEPLRIKQQTKGLTEEINQLFLQLQYQQNVMDRVLNKSLN